MTVAERESTNRRCFAPEPHGAHEWGGWWRFWCIGKADSAAPLQLDCETCGEPNAKLNRMHMCPLESWMGDKLLP